MTEYVEFKIKIKKSIVEEMFFKYRKHVEQIIQDFFDNLIEEAK